MRREWSKSVARGGRKAMVGIRRAYLPAALTRALPSTTTVRTLIAFEDPTGDDLDAVADACEPAGDPRGMKNMY